MSEIVLAIAALMLAYLLGRLRRAQVDTATRRGAWKGANQGISLDDMNELISELAPTLRATAMVTSPQTHLDRGHVWASPCGKRVYIN